MKISIITPVKNLEKYIGETIESVINQRGDFDLEYFIIDGASSDNTLKICKNYENQIESQKRSIFCNSIQLKVISEPDIGMYEALAKGLQMATGEIVAYINGDDFYLPNAFSCVAEIFCKYDDVKALSGWPIRYNEQGQIIYYRVPWQYKPELILKGFYGKQLPFIQQESVFWKSELNKIVDFERLRNFKLAGDYFLWYSFAKAQISFFVVDSFLGGNRQRKGQIQENSGDYFLEYDSIKDDSTSLDFIKIFINKVCEGFLSKPIKQRFSKNRILYRNGKWIKQ